MVSKVMMATKVNGEWQKRIFVQFADSTYNPFGRVMSYAETREQASNYLIALMNGFRLAGAKIVFEQITPSIDALLFKTEDGNTMFWAEDENGLMTTDSSHISASSKAVIELHNASLKYFL